MVSHSAFFQAALSCHSFFVSVFNFSVSSLEFSFVSFAIVLTLASSLRSSLLHSCGQSHEDHCWHTCWSYIDFREGRKLSNSACFGVLSNPKQTASVTLISHLQNCANVWQGKKMENPEQSTCCLIFQYFHPQQYYYQHSCWEFDDFLQLQQWPEYQPVNASIFKTSKHIQPFTWSKWKYEGDDGFCLLELKVGSSVLTSTLPTHFTARIL